MRKILHFDSHRDQYHCDAFVISCFDNRFEAAGRKLLKRMGVLQPDVVRIAGGAKSPASPEQEFHRTFVLEQIRKSIDLHHTKRALLILHSDCGAYGGLAGAFQGDIAAESAHHRSELLRATETVRDAFPELTVEYFFLSFEGAWEIEQQAGVFS